MVPLAILAAVAAVVSTPAAPGKPVGGKDAEAKSLSCPPRQEPEPVPTGPDLSAQGLVFDPLAPGGARPMEQGTTATAPVNPSTVTLFPVPAKPKTTGEKVEKEPDDCGRP